MPKTNLARDPETIRYAIIGARAVLNNLLALDKEAVSLLKRPSKAKTGKPKRKMSAAGRAAISAAQRKRWAKFKKSTGRTRKAA